MCPLLPTQRTPTSSATPTTTSRPHRINRITHSKDKGRFTRPSSHPPYPQLIPITCPSRVRSRDRSPLLPAEIRPRHMPTSTLAASLPGPRPPAESHLVVRRHTHAAASQPRPSQSPVETSPPAAGDCSRPKPSHM